MEGDPPDLEITLPARAENVAVVRHILGGLGDVLDLDPEVLDDMRLAVSEACANVVVHAYADGEGGLLVTTVRTDEQTITTAVRDHGRGMAPRADSPGLGVGLPLITSLARTLELSAAPGGGTEVRMTFDRTPTPHSGGSSAYDAVHDG